MKHIVVLTGAGMSADSGLKTFRDSDGLWEGYDVSEVATVEGWKKDPEKVLEFYNDRRRQAYQAKPHDGHKALVRLEKQLDVSIITQNVDSLHERAGSSNVLHLHGELRKVRSVNDPSNIKDIGGESINLGDTAEDGGQWRPHVVWFGEMVPNMEKAANIIPQADILIVIGTSLVVYPAAGLIDHAKSGIPKHIVDPSEPEIYNLSTWNHIQNKAETGVPALVRQLMNQ